VEKMIPEGSSLIAAEPTLLPEAQEGFHDAREAENTRKGI
jgi:hypothetical protein